jgi:uncharacterized protein
MMNFLRLLRSFGVFCVLVFSGVAFAQNVLPVPALTAHVVDQTGTLDALELKGLEDKLMAFEQAKGTQIAVLMVATTKPEDDASYANRVANTWKIGRKGVGDGILVLVAKDDHAVRIEVAKTLEGAVPDLSAHRIIDETMLPKFRQGDFAGGLRDGVDRLTGLVNGETLPAPAQRSERAQHGASSGFDWSNIAVFLFIGVPIVGGLLRSILGRPLGSLVTGAGVGWIAMAITSSIAVGAVAAVLALLFTLVSGLGVARAPWIGGGGFGRGGGFGGGGFGGGGGGGGWGGSGGGGDFGGGGASGRW